MAAREKLDAESVKELIMLWLPATTDEIQRLGREQLDLVWLDKMYARHPTRRGFSGLSFRFNQKEMHDEDGLQRYVPTIQCWMEIEWWCELHNMHIENKHYDHEAKQFVVTVFLRFPVRIVRQRVQRGSTSVMLDP